MVSKQEPIEGVLLPNYHQKVRGCLFRKVSVGTRKGRHLWGPKGKHREIDGVRFDPNALDDLNELKYASNKGLFGEYLARASPWLLEAKTELNRGLIGQIIVGAHLFPAEFPQVIPTRLIGVIPEGENEAAIEAFCGEYLVGVDEKHEIKIELEWVAGTINPWRKDDSKYKREMLQDYSERSDISGKIYKSVPIGGHSTKEIYGGICKPAIIDAVRLADTPNKKSKKEEICYFQGNEKEFFDRARNSEVVELIEIPRTHGSIPRLLNRGVVGRLRVGKYMLMKEHVDITVTHLAALCLDFNDPLAWVCNEKEGITTESPQSRYIPRGFQL